ncbi:MAG: hypothetical protein WD598_04735 [Acidimicrobiia bacterium]
MAVDIKKLSRGEQLICVSGIVLLIFSFFKWYKVDDAIDTQGFDPGINGWDTTLGWLAVLVGIVMVGQILASKFGNMNVDAPGSVTWGQIHLGLGVVALLFLTIRLIDVPGAFGFDEAFDRAIGLFVSFVAAVGLALGGYLKFQEEKAGGGAVPPRPPAA